MTEFLKDLVRCRTDHTLRRLILFVILTGAAGIRGHFLRAETPPLIDGHALVSMELAMTRAFCGAGSSIPIAFRVPYDVRDNPAEQAVPLRDIAIRMAGSIAAYCGETLTPTILNENSLMLVVRWLLWFNPDLSVAGIGTRLHAMRVLVVVLFGAVAVWSGLSVLAATVLVVLGVDVLRTISFQIYSLYPFLFPLVLTSAGYHAVTMRALRTASLGRGLLIAAGAGALANFGVNMRTSYLPVYLVMFGLALFVASFHQNSGRSSRVWGRVGAMTAVFVVAYAAVHYVLVARNLPQGDQYTPSYHTVAHPLILSLAIPESDLSRREGIEWSDAAAVPLAQRMIPGTVFLGPNYDRALFQYYRHLWATYPGEMASLYVRKFAMAGPGMVENLRYQRWLLPGVFTLLQPLGWIRNGILMLALFLGVAIVSLWCTLRFRQPFPYMLLLMSVTAVLLLIESAIIMPIYTPQYHNYLAMYVLTLSVLGVQAAVEIGSLALTRFRGVVTELLRDLVFFRRDAPVRRLTLFVIVAMLALPLRSRLSTESPLSNDGHALASLELAMTRVYCGIPSAFPQSYRVPYYLRDHPEARLIPIREVAARVAGGIDKYCQDATTSFIINENSLIVVFVALLQANPNLSVAQLGDELDTIRFACVLLFAAALVWSGVGVLAALAVVVAGMGVLRTVSELRYSLYPFLFTQLLLCTSYYGLTLQPLRRGRWEAVLAVAFGAGVLASFGVNLRTSYLPVYVVSFAITLAVAHASWRVSLAGSARLWRAGAMVSMFLAGYVTFQYVAIERFLPRDIVRAASYHTVAHPLVLGLAIPESELSRREGITWSDAAGESLARKMIPDAEYLGYRYDEGLFRYYLHLWAEYPGEMAWIYVHKFRAAGVGIIGGLRGQRGLVGRMAWLVLMPLWLVRNGVLLLLLFLGLTVGALTSALRRPTPFPLMLALLSAAAAMLLIESAIIMPIYMPQYHNYLEMYLMTICFLGYQGVLSIVDRWRTRNSHPTGRKTALYFDSISDDFHSRMNPFDLRARLDWFASTLDAHAGRMDRVLDVGAGLGEFSDLARARGAAVVPLDIAPRLVGRLKARYPDALCGSATMLPFADGRFDVVLSSECIEHTDDPQGAVREMLRVLRPGGVLLLTTPNLVWRWSVWVAEVLGIRKFEGVENWLSRRRLRGTIVAQGAEVVATAGVHILPFQLRPLLPFIRWVNVHGQWLKPLMINQCWVARKPIA